MKKTNILIAIVVLLFIAVVIALILTFGKKTTTIVTPGGEIEVYVAKNDLARARGLSGTRKEKLGADGMLFLFPDYEERRFWMNRMNYALDVIWLKDGKVMKIDKNVPAPEAGEGPAYMYSQPFKVNAVLEVPAGMSDVYGIFVGHTLTY